MKIFNIMDMVRNDIVVTIMNGSKVSIATACFYKYVYKSQKTVGGLR